MTKSARVGVVKRKPPEQTAAFDIAAIVTGTHRDPFAVLGVQATGKELVARCFIPGAVSVAAFALSGKPAGDLVRRDDAGFFEGRLKIAGRQPLRYRATSQTGEWSLIDPYSFGPVLGPMDDYYVAQGTHLRLFDKLGAHPIHHEGADGVHFAVWAPNAARLGRRRFQPLGRPAPCHAAAARHRNLGNLRSRCRRRRCL